MDRRPRTRKAPAQPEWLTTGQAGALLGVHGRTVVRLIQSGKLSARRLSSGQFRLSRPEVEAYAAAQTYVPTARDQQQFEEDRQPLS